MFIFVTLGDYLMITRKPLSIYWLSYDILMPVGFWQICRALAYIHGGIGVCHRDIKPQNLLVCILRLRSFHYRD